MADQCMNHPAGHETELFVDGDLEGPLQIQG